MVRELHARVGGDGPDDSRGGNGVVVVVRVQLRMRGRCTCGWVGKRHLMGSPAIVDALLHATQSGCEPAVPLAEWKLASPEEERCLRGRTHAGIVIAHQFAERQTG